MVEGNMACSCMTGFSFSCFLQNLMRRCALTACCIGALVRGCYKVHVYSQGIVRR